MYGLPLTGGMNVGDEFSFGLDLKYIGPFL
jgi:hypothetical protein